MAQDATTADPIATGQPAPMPRTGKVKESMHATIMQWFYLLLLHKTPTLGSVSPCGVEDGRLICCATGFRYGKIGCKQNIMTPRKIYVGRFC